MIRLSVAGTLLALALPGPASASVDICSDPRMQSRLAFEYVAFEASPFDEVAGTADLRYTNYDLLFTLADEKYQFGVGHRYSIFDINPIQPETNGHLHTFFLPLHVLSGTEKKNFRFSAAAAMSASSNIIKDPAEYTTDAVQLLAALIWGRQINERTSLRYGFCADHRFGEYRLYPAASVLWQLHPDWHLQLGFPDSKLSYRFSDAWRSELSIAPDGNEWYVLDSSRKRNSEFVYEALVVAWEFLWSFHDRFVISAGLGRQFYNRYEFAVFDQSRLSLSADAVNRIAIGFEWRF